MQHFFNVLEQSGVPSLSVSQLSNLETKALRPLTTPLVSRVCFYLMVYMELEVQGSFDSNFKRPPWIQSVTMDCANNSYTANCKVLRTVVSVHWHPPSNGIICAGGVLRDQNRSWAKGLRILVLI